MHYTFNSISNLVNIRAQDFKFKHALNSPLGRSVARLGGFTLQILLLIF